jgi:predicted Zn-dependent protease
MRFFFTCVAVSLLLFTPVPPLAAHGDLHDQIERLTGEIKQNPQNGELYFRRAELHRVHRDWDLALADYEMAAVLAPEMAAVDLARGRLLLEAGWPRSAIVFLDRFLEKHTRNADAFALRGRASVELEMYLEAVPFFDRAIAAGNTPNPEHYLERAWALKAAGADQVENALSGLDEGMKKLGPLVVFQLSAIDLEVERGNFDDALERLDRASARSPRKETWLFRRAEILARAERPQEARNALEAALEALNALPASRRHVPAMTELEQKINRLLEELPPESDSKTGALRE